MGTPEGTEQVARVILRLAVLTAGGVAPASAWRHIAATSSSGVVHAVIAASDVVEALVAQSTHRPALEAAGWRGLAATWAIAHEAGAPLAPALRAHAAALRALTEVQRDVAVALAGPAATVRIVAVLPMVGVLFGAALGFDTIGTLFGTPLGWACLLGGIALTLGAWWWMRRLVARARPRDAQPGLDCELLAIALAGGASPGAARALVERVAARTGVVVDHGRIDDVLALSIAAGVPAGELLRAEAGEARSEARTTARAAAASLGSRLMLPLGLGVLPAFVLVGVVPLVVSVVSSTVVTW